MVLSKNAILEALDDGQIKISPFNLDQLGPNSYDVTLHKDLYIYTDAVLDCKKPPNKKLVEIPPEGLILTPGVIYIGRTNEHTTTHNLVPIMYGKSSLGRLGLFAHICAGLGDTYYNGTWTVELAVVKPLRIFPDMQIAQIAYHTVIGEAVEYKGKYQNSIEAGVSQYYKNFKND